MKKIIIVLFVACSFAATARASGGVPKNIVQSFLNTFNDARDISWEESNGYSVASFIQNGTKRSAYYDQDGKLVVVGRQIAAAEIPEGKINQLQSAFQGYTVTAIYEMKDDFGTSYYATIGNGQKTKLVKSGSKKWKCLQTRKTRK